MVGQEAGCLDFGCINTRPAEPVAARLYAVYQGIVAVIGQWRPDMIVMEEVYVKGAAPGAALSIGQVRGVLLLAAGAHGCAVESIAAPVVKRALTGSGSAEKGQVQRALRRMLKLNEDLRSEHAADALGLAYVCAMRQPRKGQAL